MKRILLFWLLLVWFTNGSTAQSIRKDYREMTGAEMNDYVAALNLMRSTGLGGNPANHHGAGNWIDFFASSHESHFNSPIHNGRWFLPWHRAFIIEYERAMRTISGKNYLSIPYWDGRNDRDRASSTFWHNGFLAPNKLTWTISRPFNNTVQLASASSVTGILNNTTFFNNNSSSFSSQLEGNQHNPGHQWIGGTMMEFYSPLDPVFFLHHTMIDKLWDDWEEKLPFDQSDIIVNGANLNQETIEHYSPLYGYLEDYHANYASGRTPQIPSYANETRQGSIDVWYSDYTTKTVVMHGYGSNFSFDTNSSGGNKDYTYVSATTAGGSGVTGTFYIGSVKRQSDGQVVASDWGGVRVAGNCNFKAGAAILFMLGFEATYGANMVAKIVTTHNSNRQSAENSISVTESEDTRENLLLFPNPTSDNITVKVPSKFQGELDSEILDIMGNALIKKHFDTHIGELTFSVSSLKTGLYFCRVSTGTGQSLTVKFIKN
jgi:Common central domain of tyrosinase/Secretion system C-terminal sorting domain